MAELLLFPAHPAAAKPAPDPPPVPTEPLSDRDAREQALNIQCSCIVEAPAGSGKTGLLIQRYLKLLAHAEIYRPGEVLVLTFTRKADGELRDRVLGQLNAAAQGTPLPASASPFDHLTRELATAVLRRDRDRDWRLLDSPAQFNIRTIDSFCAEIASAMPLLAGGGRLDTVEDAFPLYDLAATRTLSALGGPDSILHDALRTLLLHRDVQIADCRQLLNDMLAQREQWSELLPLEARDLTDAFLDTQVRPRLERTLDRIVARGLAQAAAALGPDNVAELAQFAARLGTEPGLAGELNPLACCSALTGGLPATADHLPQWLAVAQLLLTADGKGWRKKPTGNQLGFDLQKLDKQWLEDFLVALRHRQQGTPDLLAAVAALRDLPPASYPDDQWHVVKALCRVLSHALGELRLVFSQRAQCDFTEVALTARALLQPPAETSVPFSEDPLSSPAAGLSHLLVDEMQDTSAGQYRLLEIVTEFWDGASQTIFLVGDPKQSIYAFRQARVERFLRTMTQGLLGDRRLLPLRLTANFRSQAELVSAFNETFCAIFPAGPAAEEGATPMAAEDTASVPFTAATAVRQATLTPALHWHTVIEQGSATTGSPDHQQAQEIRRLIDDFLASWPTLQEANGKARAPKIAVLARNRSHLAPVIAALRQNNGHGSCPFRAVDIEPLGDRPEILDLLALTRALLHPADRVAWLAVLRSPVCGLSLPDLLMLTGEGPGADPHATVLQLVTERGSLLTPDGQRRLERVWPTLLHAHQTLGATPFSTHLERTWRSLGGDAPLRPDEQTNAHRFLDLIRKLETGADPLSLELMDRHLHRLYAEPMAADAAVELMTIHKAKGLEWDLVLVPALERGSGRNQHPLLKWLELDTPEDEAEFLLAPIPGKGSEASSLSRWLTGGEQRRARAEAQRLFYVACTRAREALHLFCTLETKTDGSVCSPRSKDSLLQAAWPAAQSILQQQVDQLLAPLTNLVPFPEESSSEPFALAAAAEQAHGAEEPQPAKPIRLPPTWRLPDDFDPLARFHQTPAPLLPYPPAADLRRSVPFVRPEGSFAARAFGNTVHRFLPFLAEQLALGNTVTALQAEVAHWTPRLAACLRAEGLPTSVASTEARRALDALQATLQDPEGAWLLLPRAQARSETNLLPPLEAAGALRADRTFLAGPNPLSVDQATHLWIVDYKTGEPGDREHSAFFSDQKRRYSPQMQAYARAAQAAGTPVEHIILALYFPLLPRLLWWPANPHVTGEGGY